MRAQFENSFRVRRECALMRGECFRPAGFMSSGSMIEKRNNESRVSGATESRREKDASSNVRTLLRTDYYRPFGLFSKESRRTVQTGFLVLGV